MLSRKRYVIVAFVFVVSTLMLLTMSRQLDLHHVLLQDVNPYLRPKPAGSASSPLPEVTEAATPLLAEYYSIPGAGETCSRFSFTYLEQFRAHAASYCDSSSSARLTCFHRPSGFDGKTDSFCYAQGAVLDPQRGKFHLDCGLRQFSEQEKIDGLLPFDQLPAYWYETGPASIFSLAISVGEGQSLSVNDEADHSGEVERRALPEESQAAEVNALATPPKTVLLLKREGEGNPWHSFMEIFSTYMTFDILRMSTGDSGDMEPLFQHPHDSDDTQVVILDDRADGPYFDLWTLFSRKKPVRMKELVTDRYTIHDPTPVNLIVPLAGSSNPFWKDDDQAAQCTNSPILNVFSHRVLDFYRIEDTPFRPSNRPIIVTFVKRREFRRLQNQNYLFAELGRRNPHISVQMVDFAAIPLSEQLRVARETDVLVGVHGAGLTNLMFMRQGAGALVEIQPQGLDHHGFKNVAGMRSLGYFRAHAQIIPLEDWTEGTVEASDNSTQRTNRGDEVRSKHTSEPHNNKKNDRIRATGAKKLQRREEWHFQDIEIEEGRFIEVVEAAIKFMYTKGPWSFDVN
ncbi:hypothetical protein F5Y14DRAFT_91171 [Nemania sp. NC0429]|nr:hypothetical protein F5Y14DRAFT_91171 [Nemania sp. NC0429]